MQVLLRAWGVGAHLTTARVTALCLSPLLLSASHADAQRLAPAVSAGLHVSPSRAISARAARRGLTPTRHRQLGQRRVADLLGGRRAHLSLDPGLQRHVEATLRRYAVPRGAVVALEPNTGRVLAYVSHSQDDSDKTDYVLDASAPSASVFKLVTAAALLERGVPPSRRVCYSGGARGLVAAHLKDDPRRDRACANLGEALGGSINAVFAKLADRTLSRATLRRFAAAFGYGHRLPFDVATQTSRVDIPRDRLERARTAAGFWHTYLSPLHGALIAATIANRGVMPRATLVDRVLDPKGRVLWSQKPRAFRPVIGAPAAKRLAGMMHRTVSHGTSHNAFFDPHGLAFLPGIEVAGKTGSLTGSAPYRAYSWWVGFAPIDTPKLAISVLLVNGPRWRIKASYMARETLRYYLIQKRRESAAESER